NRPRRRVRNVNGAAQRAHLAEMAEQSAPTPDRESWCLSATDRGESNRQHHSVTRDQQPQSDGNSVVVSGGQQTAVFRSTSATAGPTGMVAEQGTGLSRRWEDGRQLPSSALRRCSRLAWPA